MYVNENKNFFIDPRAGSATKNKPSLKKGHLHNFNRQNDIKIHLWIRDTGVEKKEIVAYT